MSSYNQKPTARGGDIDHSGPTKSPEASLMEDSFLKLSSQLNSVAEDMRAMDAEIELLRQEKATLSEAKAFWVGEAIRKQLWMRKDGEGPLKAECEGLRQDMEELQLGINELLIVNERLEAESKDARREAALLLIRNQAVEYELQSLRTRTVVHWEPLLIIVMTVVMGCWLQALWVSDLKAMQL